MHIRDIASAVDTERANIAGSLDKAVSAGVLLKPEAATYQWNGGASEA